MVLKNPKEYDKGKTFVFLVRHGDRLDSAEQGQMIPGQGLSDLGKKQAKEVANKFAKIKDEIDVLYCSEMTRDLETAEEIGKKIGIQPIVYDGISEFNKFVWQKKIYTKNFWKHYKKHRVSLKRFDDILDKHNGKVIVIVAHGNVIKGIIGNKMGLKMNQIKKFGYNNCATTLARFKNRKLDYLFYFNNQAVFIP